MSKTLNKLMAKNTHIIESWHSEDNDGKDYWVYLKDGYLTSEGLSCIHEWTIKEVVQIFRTVRKEL